MELCRVWLLKAPDQEMHVWALVMSFMAKLNLVDTPEELRKVRAPA